MYERGGMTGGFLAIVLASLSVAHKFSQKTKLHSLSLHKTLKVTPAMAAGLTTKLMTMEDLCDLMDAVAPKPGRPKTYKKR